jgi:hypothetical protein
MRLLKALVLFASAERPSFLMPPKFYQGKISPPAIAWQL